MALMTPYQYHTLTSINTINMIYSSKWNTMRKKNLDGPLK